MRNNVRGIFENIEDDEALDIIEEPETLVTDAEAAKMHRVVDKIHTAAQKDIDFANTVNQDIEQYIQSTEEPREELNEEVEEWMREGKEVQQGYKDALNFDLQNIHYDPPRLGHPGSIEFTNTPQVVQHWRDAIQAD